jgi:hypothetical protein
MEPRHTLKRAGRGSIFGKDLFARHGAASRPAFAFSSSGHAVAKADCEGLGSPPPSCLMSLVVSVNYPCQRQPAVMRAVPFGNSRLSEHDPECGIVEVPQIARNERLAAAGYWSCRIFTD